MNLHMRVMPTKPITTTPSPDVSSAIETRVTIRQFLDKDVSDELLKNILTKALRAPSGGNLQPWNAHVLTGEALNAFVNDGLKQSKNGLQDAPTHPAYPDPLWEPAKTWRRDVGYELYSLMGVERYDKAGRWKAALRNMNFFDAPVGIIVTAEKGCGTAQYMDIGIYLQTLMLLAREAGLHTAPQGWWRNMPSLCRAHLNYPDTQEVIVGIGLGYADPEAVVNTLYSDRADLDEIVKFY